MTLLLMRRASSPSLAAMSVPPDPLAIYSLACEWSRCISDAEFVCTDGEESRGAAWPEEWQ